MRTSALPLIGAFVIGTVVGASFATSSAQTTAQSSEQGHITGIGGIFFKTDNPEETRDWYRLHLGIEGEGPGVNFFWRENDDTERLGLTVWSVFPRDTEYFGRESQDFMINYRVRDLDLLLERLEEQGVAQVGELEEYSYGRFAWIEDNGGNRIELWEPTYEEVD